MIQKYRKKPVIVEAYQITQKMVEDYLFDSIPFPKGVSLGRAEYNKTDRKIMSFTLRVDTLEGETYKVNVGDWIIKGVEGEFYPCKSDIFEATYEPVGGNQ